MSRIGGNVTATLQVRITSKNAIGEDVSSWQNAYLLTGFLDLSGGDSSYTYNAKIQDSTHIFICDFEHLTALTDDFSLNTMIPENSRLVCGGNVYNIKLIDDPMFLHEHLEIYLEYLGGGLGV